MEDYRTAQEALKKGLDGSEKKLKAFAFSLKKYVKSFWKFSFVESMKADL